MPFGVDVPGMVARLCAVLPRGWFPDTAPVLSAVLSGMGQTHADLAVLLAFVQQQTRIATAQGVFLEGAAADYLGVFPRQSNEADPAYSARIRAEIVRERGTRHAVVQVLTDLTGRAPVVFEPARSTDTGGYRTGGLGYGVAGGYGSLGLPYQMFVQAYRPHGGGIAQVAGYGIGGYPAYGSQSLVRGQVRDADIYAAIAAVLPAEATAWTRISS